MTTAISEIDEEARYRAFFSYARADGKLAAKLHRFLDSYKVPKALQGMAGKRGPVPATLHPIFHDREDLAGGGELGDRLRAALESSEALIVLCTPNSARSHWVDEEVRLFRAKNGNDAIFPVIGDGDPDSDDPEVQCMPPALRETSVLAADLRDIRKETGHIIGDGAAGGRQKLLAGLLGLDLDQLRRREDARRRRQMIAMAGALILFVALAGVATALGFAARSSAREAERQRVIAEAQAVRAQKGEALARQRAEAEALARSRESAARQLADEQRKLAEQQRALALANAAEAQRQAGIARSNATRAEAQYARAQEALADSFAQRGLAAADAGRNDLALRYALAGAQISPASTGRQRVLLARLTSAPTQRTMLTIDTNSISFLAMSPDGTRVMTSGLDKVARLFDAASGERIALTGGAMKGQTGSRPPNTRGMNADPTIGGTKLTNNWFNADSTRFLMTLADGSFELRNAQTGSAVTKIGGHRGAVLSGSFNPDGDRVLTGSLDDTARIWSLATRKEIEAARIAVPRLRSAAWAADGEGVVTMSLDQGLQLWRGGRVVATLPPRDANKGALAITADGTQAIEIDEAGVIRLSRMGDGETEVKLETRDVARGAFAISADSRFVAVGRTDGHVVVWDISSRQPVADFAAHGAAISALSLSPDNRQLATATNGGEVHLWDLLPLFAPFDVLADAACRKLGSDARAFSSDERAGDPLIGAVWGAKAVCR
ncbi:toll/interleukin-1 receptor domain-containing protein [Sphingopyxis sp. KK2]|uniref:toll/interleukin-1 receptor domain-containing protein n=1 Tax=Sphingopyxis sp. KK2 TaxID=1855727 RepID=UPI00097E6001|nr:TIR domain-containing protein [Sphingopyxis sp. KK2]